MIDIDELCFISECKTYLALVNYYQKQSDMMQHSDTFIMEASSKSSFKDKLNKLKEGFMYILRKFVQRIRIIIRKISRTKMGRGIKKAFDDMKEKHYRKKYNLPKQDGHIKDATKHRGSGHEGLTKDKVKHYINIENQTLKSWLFLYDDVDERVEIQMEFLTALDEVLDKYLHDKTYSLEMAVKELDDKTFDGDHASGYRAYYFSNGWYNTTDLRFSDKDLAEDIEFHGGDEYSRKVAEHRHIDKCRDIPFSEYIQKFQKLESDMDKIDKLATKVSGILDDILHSTKYKDDIVMGLGGSDSYHYKHGTEGDKYQYTSFDWQGTRDRYILTHRDGKYPKNESEGKDKTGKNFDSYHFKKLTGPLMYFQNYMNSMYYFMKIEYEAILEVSGDIDGGVADE